MAKKVYAVKKGKTTGIFLTWEECRKNVNGFPGAQYKSFPTLQEAEQYLTQGTGRFPCRAGRIRGLYGLCGRQL